MTTLTLTLNDDAFNDYAEFKGYTSDLGDKADFITQRLFDIIQNDLIEKRNRDAIAKAQAQPAPVVSPDQTVDEPAVIDVANAPTEGVEYGQPTDGLI